MKKSFMWLVVTVLIATFLVSFSLAGCKEPEVVVETVTETVTETVVETVTVEAEAEVYKITILCANFDDKWMSYMHQGMEEYAATITDIAEVTLVDAANESATQISQAENAIAQGVDALVIVALNTIEDNPIVDMAIDAGIPLVSINRLMKRQELVDVYVGSDEQVAGELQMGYLAEASGGEGGLVIIQGELSHSGAIGRTIGFENILEGYPGIEEVARDTCNWKREESQVLIENWVQAGLDFQIIAANNDEGAIGAILGLQSQGIDPEPYFIGGVDATPDALDFLNQGFLDCTVFQDAYGQGRGGIEAAIDILQGRSVPEVKWIPYELVEQKDYETYNAKWQ